MTNISSIAFWGKITPVKSNNNSDEPKNIKNNNTANQTSLSNITPSMKAIAIDSTKADMKKFSDIIKEYHYGKSSLIANHQNLKVSAKDGEVQIYGFHQSDKNLKEGICEELTYKAGVELQEKYGDKYIFIPVKGNCSTYNMQHYYLTAIKKTPVNEENTQLLLKKCNDMTDLAQSFMSNFDNVKEDDLKLIETKKNEVIKLKKNILKNAILIDPSFGIVKQYSNEGSINGYTQDSFFDLDTMNPFKQEPYTIPALACMFGTQIPIGYADEIAPELGLSSDSLLFMNIEACDDDVDLSIVSRTPEQFDFDEVSLDENHKLSKLLEDIEL